jgi:hypothetical protein
MVAALLLEQIFHATPTPFHARDPLAFGPVLVLLACGAAVAMIRPALHAAASDPAASLHHE